MLKSRFVPVAIDQAYQRRQKDTEGEFYRKIASQGPRADFSATTQGFYIATPSGDLLLYNNNRHPEKVRRLMKEKLAEFAKHADATKNTPALQAENPDPRWNLQPPKDGLVLRVHGKILSGYEPTENRWRKIFQNALSRDNMWITDDEKQSILGGELPEMVAARLARNHLMDGTRGEPLMWKDEELRSIALSLKDGVVSGSMHLETKDGKRGYQCELKGFVETNGEEVTRFDVVALGQCWGEGPYTKGAPPGKFPLAISFSLADGSDIADAVPPQGCKGWLEGYLR